MVQSTDVEQKAQSALATSPIYDLRNLRVEQSHGQLCISGRVHSFYHKQMAQEVVRAVAGGVQVVNEIAVD